MLRANRPANGLRFGLLLLTAIVAVTAITTDPADARGRRKRFHGPAYSPPYAALVIDANSGQVLHNTNADAQRHPASLTKIMTLYLLFEQIESGKMRLDTEMDVSDHASQQAPSKLGLRPGQTISVEDAIRALVTKSANDVAVVISEAIGGDEETFARMMTRKARVLGMSKTVYMNASGLPDDDQLTTARDQVTLGRAIQERFPRYYRYFQTASFNFRGRSIRNHNKLLGRVEGVDGIKTGYTRASGFNLVSSMRRGNRHLVACVLGGASGGARDAKMRSLLEQTIASASTNRTVARVTDNSEVTTAAVITKSTSEPRIARDDAPVTVSSIPVEKPVVLSEAPVLQSAPVFSQAPKPGSGDPINPVKVKTISVKAGNIQTASLAPLVIAAPSATIAPPHFAKTAASAAIVSATPSSAPLPPPPGARPGVLGVLPVEAAAPTPVTAYQMASSASMPARVDTTPAYAARGPWLIQLGAFPKEAEAKERLSEAQSVGKTILGKAKPFTEKFVKGSQEYHRARFDGLSQASAEAACGFFKRKEIPCMAIRM